MDGNSPEIVENRARRRKASAGGRKAGGRQKGTPNKTTAEIRQAARLHGPAIIAELARLAFHAESEAVQVAAIKELLDRGYGKAPRPHDGYGQSGARPVTIIMGQGVHPPRPGDGGLPAVGNQFALPQPATKQLPHDP